MDKVANPKSKRGLRNKGQKNRPDVNMRRVEDPALLEEEKKRDKYRL